MALLEQIKLNNKDMEQNEKNTFAHETFQPFEVVAKHFNKYAHTLRTPIAIQKKYSIADWQTPQIISVSLGAIAYKLEVVAYVPCFQNQKGYDCAIVSFRDDTLGVVYYAMYFSNKTDAFLSYCQSTCTQFFDYLLGIYGEKRIFCGFYLEHGFYPFMMHEQIASVEHDIKNKECQIKIKPFIWKGFKGKTSRLK